jgi:hypothetical protein
MSAYRGLASPYDALDFDALEVLAVNYQRRVVQTVLSRFGALLEARGDGVSSLLSDWIDSPSDFEEIFDSSFGRIGELLKGRRRRLGDFDEEHYEVSDYRRSCLRAATSRKCFSAWPVSRCV